MTGITSLFSSGRESLAQLRAAFSQIAASASEYSVNGENSLQRSPLKIATSRAVIERNLLRMGKDRIDISVIFVLAT